MVPKQDGCLPWDGGVFFRREKKLSGSHTLGECGYRALPRALHDVLLANAPFRSLRELTDSM